MPSPNYPSEVVCLGSNKNLFDKDNAKEGYFFSTSEVSNSLWCYAVSEDLKAGKEYTTSGGRCVLAYFNNDTYISNQDITNQTVIIPENVTKAYISVLIENMDIFKIEEGNTATSYSPYRTR